MALFIAGLLAGRFRWLPGGPAGFRRRGGGLLRCSAPCRSGRLVRSRVHPVQDSATDECDGDDCPAEQFERAAVDSAVVRDSAGNPTSTICQVAASNYIGVFGVREPGIDGDGVFFRNSFIGIRDIVDGTSSTLLVGERSQRWCEATWVGAVTNAQMFPPPGSPAVPFVENASGMILGHTFEGPPNTPGLECNDFTSQHTGGAHFVFADGHVQFISTSMNKLVFRALSTRAGGESIGDF